MSSYLNTWKADDGAMTLRLYDTGTINRYGKSRLRYDLSIHGVEFEGSDFCPSPGIAIGSDEAAGVLLSFMAYYGESLFYGGEDAERFEEFTPAQRETLMDARDDLQAWSYLLVNDIE